MADFIWSEKQKEIIEQHRDENLLVSAAAGSGKTTVLTERIAQICEAGTELENILVMTFTNAAASKMKADIIKRTGISPFTKTHICTFDKFCIEIYRQYYHVIDASPRLKICDELKNTILKEEALEELFSRLFEENDARFTDFLDHYCDSKTNNAAKEMILRFYEFICNMPDPENWLLKLSSGELLDAAKFNDAALSEAARRIEESLYWVNKIGEILNRFGEDGTPCMSKLALKNAEVKSCIEAVFEMVSEGRSASDIAEAAGCEWPTYRAAKEEKPYWEDIKDLIGKTLKPKAQRALKEASAYARWAADGTFDAEKDQMLPYICTLCWLTGEFKKLHTVKKRRAGLMDFSDSAHFALEILKDPEVRREYREQFRYIFIDEYQDSNYVQEALIDSIRRENNVFMVGDIKQGIYEFRFAETEIFLDKYKRYKSGAAGPSAVVDLNQNYRSKRPIIEFVNRVFSRMISEETMNMRYDEGAALHEGDSPYRGEHVYEPEMYLISSDTEEVVDDAIADLKKAELEALNAAAVIKKYHGCMINDGKKDRPLQYRDMAVLLRGVKKGRFSDEGNGEVFYRTFMEQGIPVYLERSEGYFDTPEVQVFLNLLRVIDNPRNDVPLLSVMHFPSFSFSADELAKIRIFSKKDRRKTSFYEALCTFAGSEEAGQFDDALKVRVDSFFGKLTRWRRAASCTPIADVLWKLLSESGIADFARALPGGSQRIANLRAMADKAQEFQAENAGGIGDFIRLIDHYKKNKVEIGQTGLLGQEDDVVRIMTIHKSKGLEFPFVMLCGLGSSAVKAASKGSFLYHRKLGGAIKLTDPKLQIRTTPMSFKLVDNTLKDEEYAENIRVLYVAATRARDILVMSAAVKDADKYIKEAALKPKKAQSYLDMVLPALDLSRVIRISRSDLASTGETEVKREELKKGIASGFGVLPDPSVISLEELKERLSFKPVQAEVSKKKYSVSELAEIRRHAGDSVEGVTREDAQPDKMQERRQLDKTQKDRQPYGTASYGSQNTAYRSASGLTAAEKGNAYHSVMEHIPFTDNYSSAEAVRQFIGQMLQKHMLTEAEAHCVEPERIAAFFNSDMGRRAMASRELHKEAPFVMKTDHDGHEILVQGVIDCYFREGDSYILIDYKSNFVDESSPEEEKQRLRDYYLPQLELYKEALEGISGIPVAESYLYVFGLNSYAKT